MQTDLDNAWREFTQTGNPALYLRYRELCRSQASPDTQETETPAEPTVPTDTLHG